KKPCQNVRVEKDMLLKFFSELFLYGVNSIRAVSEEDIFNIQLDEIVRRPDTNTPDGKKLLENPQLQLSMLYYMQELRRGLEKINVDEYRDMEEEMIINIMRAKYILPVKEEEEDGKKSAKLMYIKLKNGQSFVPILTDGMEFARFRGKQVDLQARIIDFENMSKMKLPDEVSGFLINPPTANVPVFKKHIEKWLSGFSWK
ncbi:MAG: SseB family protein, partial [Roseburia sp.]